MHTLFRKQHQLGMNSKETNKDLSKLKMEDTLHERLIGQHHAIVSVSKAVRRARVGIQDPKRPIASFIFIIVFNPLLIRIGQELTDSESYRGFVDDIAIKIDTMLASPKKFPITARTMSL